MKVTPRTIKNLVEEYVGFDIATKARQDVYVNAKVLYSKLCSDHLRLRYTMEKCANEIGQQHADLCYHVNKAFYVKIKDPLFQELYIELSDQLKKFKELEKQTKPYLKPEVDKKKALDVLQGLLWEKQVRIERMIEAAKDPMIKDIQDMDQEQRDYLRERISPAIDRTKREFKK